MKNKRRTLTKNTIENPITRSIIKRQIETSLITSRNAAGLQAVVGTSSEKLTEHAGKLLFAVARACESCRISKTDPDVRILRGMAGALELLARFPATLEDHRPAIQSGLDAIERLLPRLHIYAIGNGFLECDLAIAATGFGANDIHSMLEANP